MAANYWCSSQRLHWQMSRDKLAETRRALEAQDERTVTTYPLASYRLLSIFFNQRIPLPLPLSHPARHCNLTTSAG